jgi:hypothetical protein
LQPIVDCGADFASLERRIARPGMAGDQQQNALVLCDRAFERPIDCAPRLVESLAVKVENAIRLGRPRPEPPVPARIEGLF